MCKAEIHCKREVLILFLKREGRSHWIPKENLQLSQKQKPVKLHSKVFPASISAAAAEMSARRLEMTNLALSLQGILSFSWLVLRAVGEQEVPGTDHFFCASSSKPIMENHTGE